MLFRSCSGGCDGGQSPELTEEIVLEAERNTARLRTWWENKKLKDSYICLTCGKIGHLMCSRGMRTND